MEWLTTFITISPFLYVIIAFIKGDSLIEIVKYSLLISLISGVLMAFLMEPHPHVPRVAMLILFPLYSLIIIIVVSFLKFLFRTIYYFK